MPESVIMACKPGEIFVHRNIAKSVIFVTHASSASAYSRIMNTLLLLIVIDTLYGLRLTASSSRARTCSQFHLHDDSAQSVLTYAVEHLGVEHGEDSRVVTIIVDGNVVHLHCGEQEREGELKASVGRFFFSMWMWVCVEIQIEGTRRLGKDEGWLCPVIDPDSGHLRRNIE